MRPGKPVYFERSTTAAPEGIAEASLVTALMRSPSTIAMALVHSLPLASQSLPKRTALVALGTALSCAEAPESTTARARKTSEKDKWIRFMVHTPSLRRTFCPARFAFLMDLARECNRKERRSESGRTEKWHEFWLGC